MCGRRPLTHVSGLQLHLAFRILKLSFPSLGVYTLPMRSDTDKFASVPVIFEGPRALKDASQSDGECLGT